MSSIQASISLFGFIAVGSLVEFAPHAGINRHARIKGLEPFDLAQLLAGIVVAVPDQALSLGLPLAVLNLLLLDGAIMLVADAFHAICVSSLTGRSSTGRAG